MTAMSSPSLRTPSSNDWKAVDQFLAPSAAINPPSPNPAVLSDSSIPGILGTTAATGPNLPDGDVIDERDR